MSFTLITRDKHSIVRRPRLIAGICRKLQAGLALPHPQGCEASSGEAPHKPSPWRGWSIPQPPSSRMVGKVAEALAVGMIDE
jgi:hypothetical protein